MLSDQAAGLRKLLQRGELRSVTVASAAHGDGRSMFCTNLATVLTSRGLDVLLMDSTQPLDARQRERVYNLPQVIDAPRGILRIQAVDFSGNGAESLRHLAQVFGDHPTSADFLLVDPPPGDLTYAVAARALILLVTASADGVTDAYRLLKRLHAQWGRRKVLIVLNRVKSPAHADRIFGNLSATSKRFLNLPLDFMGFIPDDECVSRAARMQQSVVEAFPESNVAQALRGCAERLLRWPHSGEDGFAEFAHRLLEAYRFPVSQN